MSVTRHPLSASASRPSAGLRRPRARPGRLVVVGVAGALLLAACSSDGDGEDGANGASTTTAPVTTAAPTTTAPGTAPTPQPTLRVAVEGLLAAEVEADAATSFRFLGDEAREQFRDVAEWTTRRSQLPQTTGYEIVDATEDDTVVAEVTHPPGIDPFIGLSPARERQTFTGQEVDGGWLVAAEPDVELILPPASEAPPVVESWGAAVQACDEAAGAELEAVDEVFGASVGASELCGSTGEIATGEPEELLAGPQSTDLIAQYTTDILSWAQVVPVTAPVSPFFVVMAPIGDDWRVLAVYD